RGKSGDSGRRLLERGTPGVVAGLQAWPPHLRLAPDRDCPGRAFVMGLAALARGRPRSILGVSFDWRASRGGLWRECRQHGGSPVRRFFAAANRSLPDRPRTVTGCLRVASVGRGAQPDDQCYYRRHQSLWRRGGPLGGVWVPLARVVVGGRSLQSGD